jgi:RNA polymerase-binding transcription factor DksA
MAIDTSFFKTKLDEEKKRLERELGTVAEHDQSGSWEAVNTVVDESTDADSNEVADKIEEYENNHAIADSLKRELNDVNDALAKIEAGTYGICEVSGEPIEEDRLMANPSARTNKEHMNS